MPSNDELAQLQAEISARANAMRTQPLGSSAWNTNKARLQDSLTDARVLISLGRGVAGTAEWDSFLNTVERQSYSLSAETALVAQGQTQRPSEQQPQLRLILGEAERIDVPVSQPARAAPVSTPAPSTPSSGTAIVKSAPPEGWVAPVDQPRLQTAGMLPGGSPMSLFAWLNPSDRPVYRRPWFIGTAVLTIAGVTYYGIKKGEKK